MERGRRSMGSWEYIDFELEVREGDGGRKYPVCVRSPAGETTTKAVSAARR